MHLQAPLHLPELMKAGGRMGSAHLMALDNGPSLVHSLNLCELETCLTWYVPVAPVLVFLLD